MKKTTGILLSIAVLAMLIGGSGAVYYYKQAEKSVTPLKESYTLKNKQAGEELHLSLKGKGLIPFIKLIVTKWDYDHRIMPFIQKLKAP